MTDLSFFLFRHTTLSTKLFILAVCRPALTYEPTKRPNPVRHDIFRNSIPEARRRLESGK